jgi:parallel beta-helix repeat protein
MISRKLVALSFTIMLLSAGALAALSLLGSSPAAHAALAARYVAISGNDTDNDCTNPSSPCRTVQHAVDEASSGDTILVAEGVYTDVHGRPRPANYDAPPAFTTVYQVVLVTETVTIRGGYTTDFGPPDPEAHPTILDAGGQGRVLLIAEGTSPTIEGLRLTGGDATGLYGEGGPVDAGGGVYCTDATAVFSGNLIYSNTAGTGNSYGGGLHVRWSDVTLTNNVVVSNTASYGGGIRLYYADGVLGNNTFSYNTAANGGGVVLSSCETGTTFDGNTVISNTATTGSGGGIYVYSCPSTISGSTVMSNTAGNQGGGLYLYAEDDATVQDNTFTANVAEDGGGLNLYMANATLLDNRIIDNTAEAGAGLLLYYSDATLIGNAVLGNSDGIFMRQSSPELINNVIANNTTSAYYSSGIYVYDGSHPRLTHTTIANNGGPQSYGLSLERWTDPCSAVLTNTILTGHTTGIYVEALSSATLEGTLWQNGTDWDGYGEIVTGTHNTWGDPRFGPDGYHLMAGSAAIDRGINAGVTIDIDGEPRPQGSAPDLGADECWSCITLRVYLPLVMRGY